MFEGLTSKLQGVFRKLGIKGRLSEKNIEEGLREVRTALLEADVSHTVARDFIDRVTKKAIGQEVIRDIRPEQQIIKIIYDEMTALMGPVEPGLKLAEKPPTIIMMVGLQGSGKTTTCGKLARFWQKKGHAPCLVAADLQRPAAVEQLKVLGEQINVPVYTEAGGRPPKVCERGVQYATNNARDIVILDTAGRLHINQELMDELKDVQAKVKPHHIFLVADAMTGQDAVNSAKEFDAQLPLTGVILTKLDGDARGGAALTIKAITGKPIKYVGVGEKLENLDEFYPERMAQRILGMGDVVSLVERAQEVVDQDVAEKMRDKMMEGDFTLADMLAQLQQAKKIGSMKDIAAMIPGMGEMMQGQELDESELKHVEAMIQSMTVEEREHPELIDGSRRARIAKGSGVNPTAVSGLLKQHKEMRKMMRSISRFGLGGLGKLMGKMRRGPMPPGGGLPPKPLK